jgi:hypothetical protein
MMAPTHNKANLTRSLAISRGMRHSLAMRSRTPALATRWAICETAGELGG